MTLVVDLLAAQRSGPHAADVARTVAGLAVTIERASPGVVDTWLVHTDAALPDALTPLVSTGRVVPHDDRRRWPADETGTFVTTSLFDPACPVPMVVPARYDHPAWRRVALVHDVPPLDGDAWPGGASPFNARRDLARSMDLVLATTPAVARAVIAGLGLHPERVVVVGTGLDPAQRPDGRGHEVAVAEMHAHPPFASLRARFLLCQADRAPAVDLDTLGRAYAALPDEVRAAHQLVVVGPVPSGSGRVLETMAADPTFAGDVRLAGAVDDDVRIRMHQAAHLVVVPSVRDLGGTAVLEALATGAPVVASDLASLRDLVTHPAARFPVGSPTELSEVLRVHLTDDAARREAVGVMPPDRDQRRAAQATVDALTPDAAAVRRRPRRRAHVALVSPLPPMTSGIADYAAKLIPALRAEVDLTVFVDADVESVTPIDGVSVAATSSFAAVEAEGVRFDRVVTFLGNSPFHLDALDVVRRHAGTVVLHDVRLAALYSEVARRHPRRLDPGGVGAVLARLYPGRYDPALEAMTVVDPGTAAQHGVHLLAEVVATADDVLVHSRYAADITEIDTGQRPTIAFGLPFDPPVEASADVAVDGGAARASRPFAIVTLGHLTPVKQPEVLLDAVAALRATHDVTVTFCGSGPEDYLAYLRARIAALGLDDVAHVTGYLDASAYRAATAAADVAVQLRAFTNGESSAALHDALAAGLPAVCRRVGAMAEYPDDVVRTIGPADGAPELAAALAALADDAEARAGMSRRARRHAGERSYPSAASALLERLGL